MEERAKYTQKDRDSMAKKGQAMSDGSYPIADEEDLDNAIHAVGRGGADHDSIRKHIMARAKALGLSSKIPDNWNSDGSIKASAPGLDTRKAKAELLRGREVRRLTSTEMECRTVDGRIQLSGLASSTESPYDMGWYTETIKRGAFAQTLSQNPDVQLLINHEGLPLARTTNGSLVLRESDSGLMFDAYADESDPDMARVASKVRAGLMDQCSFAFRVIRQTWDEDYEDRQINEVSLDRGDVSVVNYGANPNTSVTLRSLFSDMSEITDEQLEELRQDPAVITIVRRLAIPPVLEPPAVDDPPSGAAHDLRLYQARARALALRIL